MIARSLLPALLLVAAPSGVLAYSDPAAFAAPVLEAGGGGRFYTGSPAEGFGCESCHGGGEAPELRIEGLPARYAPRATYELRVSWSRKVAHAAAALELTDDRGRGAGMLALPPAGEFIDDEQCEPREVGLLAAQLYPADRERTIAAMPDCGASALRVQWTAPARNVGPVWLAGSVLSSDHEGNLSGDGARTFARGIPPFGEALPEIVTTAGCSTGSRSTSAPPACAWVVVLLFALRRRVRSA
ncbi:MAG TPA: choice-of-anchor V domain-containing protein [Polyangiales bacterium]|nr:choice-of-anchor V domain-containing protein [Polyangiales bacterium]